MNWVINQRAIKLQWRVHVSSQGPDSAVGRPDGKMAAGIGRMSGGAFRLNQLSSKCSQRRGWSLSSLKFPLMRSRGDDG